jgi:hypothetical protein
MQIRLRDLVDLLLVRLLIGLKTSTGKDCLMNLVTEGNNRAFELLTGKGMAERLGSLEWDYRIDVTFRWERREFDRVLAAGRFLDNLYQPQRAFWAVEPFHKTAGLHLHGLFKLNMEKLFKPTASQIMKVCNKHFGISTVKVIKEEAGGTMGATAYVCKYAAGSGMYDFFPYESSAWTVGRN